jgi:hypothetical protein
MKEWLIRAEELAITEWSVAILIEALILFRPAVWAPSAEPTDLFGHGFPPIPPL